MALTPKQEAFAREYLVDLNASAAYRRAGYTAKTEHVSAVESSKLLTNPDVQAVIQEAMDKRAKATGITAERVLTRLAAIAFADPRELTEYHVTCCGSCWGVEEGEEYDAAKAPDPDCKHCLGRGVGEPVLRDTRTLSPAAAGLFAGVKKTKDGTQVLTHDPLKALELLGRHLKLFVDKIEIEATGELAVRLAQAQERLKGKT